MADQFASIRVEVSDQEKKAEDVEMNGEQKDQHFKGLTEFGLPNLQRVIKKEGPINAELL